MNGGLVGGRWGRGGQQPLAEGTDEHGSEDGAVVGEDPRVSWNTLYFRLLANQEHHVAVGFRSGHSRGSENKKALPISFSNMAFMI